MAYCILSSMPPFSPPSFPYHISPSAAISRGISSFLYLLRRRSGT